MFGFSLLHLYQAVFLLCNKLVQMLCQIRLSPVLLRQYVIYGVQSCHFITLLNLLIRVNELVLKVWIDTFRASFVFWLFCRFLADLCGTFVWNGSPVMLRSMEALSLQLLLRLWDVRQSICFQLVQGGVVRCLAFQFFHHHLASIWHMAIVKRL